MIIEISVVRGRVEKPRTTGTAIGVEEKGEACEMDTTAARELDARATAASGRLAANVIADRAQDVAKATLVAWTNGREHGQCSREHVGEARIHAPQCRNRDGAVVRMFRTEHRFWRRSP